MLKIAWSPIYHHPLPEGHRFPMEKYSLLPEQLLYEGLIGEDNLFEPGYCADKEILRVHDAAYLERLKRLQLSKKEERRTGFPHNQQLIDRELIITQGSVDGVRYALDDGLSFNIAGGTHHAYRDRGEGFCLLNDIAVAGAWLLANSGVRRILVIDLDVHQGNGTAKIMEGDERVYTFSMHGKDNYPLHKEQSDWDIPLETGTGDGPYLDTLAQALKVLPDKALPDFVFFQAGVDVLEQDKLGKLGLSLWGCAQRDQLVFEFCKEKGLPVFVNMGGGYSPQLSVIVNAHAQTYRSGMAILQP